MRNPYLGPFVSGELTGAAWLSGKTGALDRMTGAAEFAIARGTVINPYERDAARVPANVNLSHFDFYVMTGAFGIAEGKLRIGDFTLRSTMIDLDLGGSIGFDGSLEAGARASMLPELIQVRGCLKSKYWALNIWCCPTPVVIIASPFVSLLRDSSTAWG